MTDSEKTLTGYYIASLRKLGLSDEQIKNVLAEVDRQREQMSDDAALRLFNAF